MLIGNFNCYCQQLIIIQNHKIQIYYKLQINQLTYNNTQQQISLISIQFIRNNRSILLLFKLYQLSNQQIPSFKIQTNPTKPSIQTTTMITKQPKQPNQFSLQTQNQKQPLPIHPHKLILNLLQLLSHQLNSKQLKTKKQSLQTLHIIALAMSEKQIVNQLVPFLVKLMVEQNNKEIKIIIVKGMKNIVQLVYKAKSYIKVLETLFDIVLVFQEVEIRQQAINVLNYLFYQVSGFKYDRFKDCLKGLVSEQLIQITDVGQLKNSKQLIIHIIRYFLTNQKSNQQLTWIFEFLKKNFIFDEINPTVSINILYQNLHLLVQKWPQNSISQLQYYFQILIPTTTNNNTTNCNNQQKHQQKTVQQSTQQTTTINNNNNNNQQQSQQQPQQQQPSNNNKPQHEVMTQNKQQQKQPQLRIPPHLTEQQKVQLKSFLISALINYSKTFRSNKKAFGYLRMLMNQQSSKVQISLIKRINHIIEQFKQQDLQPLITKFKTFSSQSLQMKKALIQMIDQLVLFDPQNKTDLMLNYCKNSIELKNILIQSLIKSNQHEIIGQIINDSDYDFKIKIFNKLSNEILHNNRIYANVIESLLVENKKNFRSKLNVVQNLITRIEQILLKEQLNSSQSSISQVFDISYLFTTLTKYFNDRIAVIRINLAKLCALLLFCYQIDFNTIKDTILQNFYGQNKNWFERQNVLIMLNQYFKLITNEKNTQTINTNSKKRVKQAVNSSQNKQSIRIVFIQIIKDAKQGDYKKWQKQEQNAKVQIRNISNLAQAIINEYNLLNN